MDNPDHSESSTRGEGIEQHRQASPTAILPTTVQGRRRRITESSGIMALRIEENIEEAMETFARLTMLGNFARAAELFATTLEDHLDLFPIFAEHASFLIQQGKFGNLLNLVERRKAAYRDEKIYLDLLRALSLLHCQGQLADALKACGSLESKEIRPPEELSAIQVRSIEIQIKIFTDVFSIRPNQFDMFYEPHFWSITSSLPKTEERDVPTTVRFSPNGDRVFKKLHTWCAKLAKVHPQEAEFVFRMLLKVAPFQPEDIGSLSSRLNADPWTINNMEAWDAAGPLKEVAGRFEILSKNMTSSNENPPSILAKVGAINAYLAFLLRYKSPLHEEAEAPQFSEFPGRFSKWRGRSPEQSRHSKSLKNREKFFEKIGGKSKELIEMGESLLHKLYDGRRDLGNQQLLELQINKHKFNHAFPQYQSGNPDLDLGTIAAIAQEHSNHRIQTQWLETMIYTQKVTKDFWLWSMAPFRISAIYSGLRDTSVTHDAVKSVEILLQLDHSVAKSPRSRPCLIFENAVSAGIFEPVNLMLELGFPPMKEYEEGRSALHLAAYHGQEHIARLILEHNPTCSSLKDGEECLPLHLAAENGHVSLLELLMGFEQSYIRQKNGKGLTALHLAAANGHEMTVTSLLGYGANAEEGDEDGWTALHWASSRWYYGVVYLLLRHGADVNSKTNDGTTAIDLAAKCGHRAMVLLLLANQADICTPSEGHTTALHFAAENGNEDLARLLLEKGATILSKTRRGNTALHVAARKNNVEVAKVLLNEGTDVTTESRLTLIRAANLDGDTALHAAAEEGHQDVVELLLVHGADIHHLNDLGRTALHVAVEKGHKHIVELLLQNPEGRLAVDDHLGDYGETALTLAERLHHREIARLLRGEEEVESQEESDGEKEMESQEELEAEASSSSESDEGPDEIVGSP